MPDVQKLLNAIDAAEAVSYGADDGGDLSQDRAASIDRYLGRNINAAPEGRSQVRSRDTFETIEWIKPSLLRIYTGSDEVVKFEPHGAEDEPQAQQESDYVNYVVTQRNNWHQVCHDWFTDALMVKNGYAYAYWDDRKIVEKETYEAQSEDSIAFLLKDDDVEVTGHSAYPEPDYQPQPMMQQGPQGPMPVIDETGQPMMQPPPMLHDIELRRVRTKGVPKICVIPPERCKISERTPDFTLLECDYFEFWEMKTISDLRTMGYKVEDTIGDDGRETDTEEDDARDQYNEQSWNTDDNRIDPAMRRVKARAVWIRYDYDEDGISELQYCLVVGNELLYREECNRIPVASLCPIPLPHRHIGLSVSDIVSDLEDIKSAILRQGIDNIFLTNNQRTAVNEDALVNMDDLLNNVPGGVVRVKGIPSQHLMEMQTPFMFDKAIAGMEYLDQIRQNRAGVNAYFTGVDQNALNKTASGIAQLTSSSAQRVELIARIFSVGVKELFSIVHELILKHGHQKEVVRLRNEWVTVDPAQWRKRTDLTIAVGMGTGSKEAMMAHLQSIFGAQMALLQTGTGVVRPENLYATSVELAKAAGFANADKFYTDPVKNPPPQQGPPPQMIVEMEKLKAQGQNKQMDLQAGAQIEQMKLAHDAQKTQLVESNKLQIAQLQSQTQQVLLMMKEFVETQKMAMDQQSQAHAQRMDGMRAEMEYLNQAQGQQKGESGKMAQDLMQVLAQMAERMETGKTARVERVRDQGGRMIGARLHSADGSVRDVPIQ